MKFTATSCIALLISGALVSGCGQGKGQGKGQASNVQAPNVQASNFQEINKIRGVIGMTKTQVKEVLGTPESANDDFWKYDTIQPDSGKPTLCFVWFHSKGGQTVSKIDC